MEIYDKKQDAFHTHARIIAAAELITKGALELGKNAKKMRDEKLYIELGFENFDDYTQKVLNMGERQAYNYIRVYEKYPPQQLENYSEIGVTKLGYLIDIPVTEREEFIESQGVDNLKTMSTKEVEELVKKNTIQAEQIELLGVEVSKLSEIDKQKADFEVKFKKEKEAKEKLERTIKELKNKPTFEDLEEMKTEVKLELAKDFDKQKAELEENHKKQIAELQKQKEVDLEKAQKLVKENSLTSDPAIVEMMVYFNDLQELCEKMKKTSSFINDTEKRAKVIGVVTNFIREIEI